MKEIDEMMKACIKITKDSFSESYIKTEKVYFRSLEKFLEKINRKFDYDVIKKVITVNVTDEMDARHLAEKAKLNKVEYYADDNIKELIIFAIRKPGKQKNVISLNGGNKYITPNRFQKHLLKELQITHLTKAEIIKKKILTRTQLEKFIANKTLQVVHHGNKILINRKELSELINP